MRIQKGNVDSNEVMIPYTFSKQKGESRKLAVLLPDKEYSVQGPLFWYTSQKYVENGYDILQFNYSFSNIDEEKLSVAINEMLFSFLQKRAYDTLHFVSLGLGSTVVADILGQQLYPNAQAVWLSPYIHHSKVLHALVNRRNKGLVFFGEMGDLVHEEDARFLEEKDHLLVAHVAGGNDQLETPWAEINANTMSSIMQLTQSFINDVKIELIEEQTKICAYFSLYGDDFPLEEVTEKLGIQPTKTEKKGDEIIAPNGRINPRNRRYYIETCWEIHTDYEESIDLEIQMDKLIGLLSDKTLILNELREKYQLKSHIQVVVEIKNGNSPALTLSKKIIDFAHQIQTEYIDVDQYVMSFDENLRFENFGIDFKGRKLT